MDKPKKIIVWDLGATKCAAALVEYTALQEQFVCKKTCTIKIRACESLEALTSSIESLLEISMTEVDAICIGAAGQYDGQCLQLDKGYPYEMAFAKLAKKQHWPTFDIIHDYSPIVCATFVSGNHCDTRIKHLNKNKLNKYGRRVALGVGTGIGLKDGVLFPDGHFWLGTNEMGHIGIVTPPLANKEYLERHNELIRFMRSEAILGPDESLTYEKLLAANGIVRIHSFFDERAKHRSAEEIGELVRNGGANETLATFAWYLGLLVGTVQLTFMPDGGIWITGGVILNHLEVFDQADFYAGIESSPTYLNLRKEFPLGVLIHNEHPFIGGAYYAAKRLLSSEKHLQASEFATTLA